MSRIKLFKHQQEILDKTKEKTKVAYFLDMGLGKTFIGSYKAISLNKPILVVCQKSLLSMWQEHFKTNYQNIEVYDLTKSSDLMRFVVDTKLQNDFIPVGIINYDLLFRRPELLAISHFTLLLDESSLIQNYTSKQTKAVFKLKNDNLILLSGTPTSGRYDKLWTQVKLLGWNISKLDFESRYVNYDLINMHVGFPIKVLNKTNPYKNVDELKTNLRKYAVFMKTDDIIELPTQNFIDIKVDSTKEYREFVKNRIVELKDRTLVGDTALNRYLYTKQLASCFNQNKYKAIQDLIDSTEDRLIIFYNWNVELSELIKLCKYNDRPYSQVNGFVKDLTFYEQNDNSISLINYQAGALGLNLQKANTIIYFSPTDKCELYMQSLKRIHRLGQQRPCFYYRLISGIDTKIYNSLSRGVDYTEKLFEEEE